MKYFLNMNSKEISAKTGLNASTVRGRLREAVKMMRRMLEK